MLTFAAFALSLNAAGLTAYLDIAVHKATAVAFNRFKYCGQTVALFQPRTPSRLVLAGRTQRSYGDG